MAITPNPPLRPPGRGRHRPGGRPSRPAPAALRQLRCRGSARSWGAPWTSSWEKNERNDVRWYYLAGGLAAIQFIFPLDFSSSQLANIVQRGWNHQADIGMTWSTSIHLITLTWYSKKDTNDRNKNNVYKDSTPKNGDWSKNAGMGMSGPSWGNLRCRSFARWWKRSWKTVRSPMRCVTSSLESWENHPQVAASFRFRL